MAWGVLSYMDIAFIVILLISAINGAVKGFAKQFFSLVAFIGIIIVAGFTCEWLGEFLYPVFGESIESGFKEWITKNDVEGLFTTAQNWTEQANVEKALTALKLPALISGLISGIITGAFASFGESAVLVDELPPVLAKWSVNVIAFVIILLLLAIVLIVIKHFVFKLVKKPGVSGVNRLLGCVISLVYTYAMLSVILMIISTLLTNVGLFTGIQQFLSEQAKLSAGGYFPVFNIMYTYNFVGQFLLKQFLMIIPG
jgi:uncharacterized membrane protein required for colicin V production